jgi:hypothetical protein
MSPVARSKNLAGWDLIWALMWAGPSRRAICDVRGPARRLKGFTIRWLNWYRLSGLN